MPESSPTYKMHRRSPVRIGFCVSFPVGSVLALGSMISTQAMPAATVIFLYLAVVWFVLYAACGAKDPVKDCEGLEKSIWRFTEEILSK